MSRYGTTCIACKSWLARLPGTVLAGHIAPGMSGADGVEDGIEQGAETVPADVRSSSPSAGAADEFPFRLGERGGIGMRVYASMLLSSGKFTPQPFSDTLSSRLYPNAPTRRNEIG